jgi:hydrogenase 3 maturation protease
MEKIEENLETLLSSVKKVVVLGAGSILRADDAAGVMAAEGLATMLGGDCFTHLRIMNGSTAPENLTGEIKQFGPDLVIMIDAADIHRKPGSVALIDAADVGGVSFSTHMLPLKIMIEYLKKEVGCALTIVGIQPKELCFGGEVTPEVQKAVSKLVEVLGRLLKEPLDVLKEIEMV